MRPVTLKPRAINMRGKKPQTFIRQGEDSRNLRLGYVMLRAGESVGEHCTEGKEEIIVVLAGTARVRVQGRAAFTLSRDAIAYIPPERIHNVTNAGRSRLRYVYITCPVVQSR